MTDSKWKLTPDQSANVERGHREMMKFDAMDIKPIRLAAKDRKKPKAEETEGSDADDETTDLFN